MLNIQQKFHLHIHKIHVQNKKWERQSFFVQDPELFLYEYVNILLPMIIHSCDINPSFFLKAEYNLWRQKWCLPYQNAFKDKLFIHSHFQLDTLPKIGCSYIEVWNFYTSLSDFITFFSFYTCFNIVSPLSKVLVCQFLFRCYILKTCLDL